jgi:hypothetical protein
MRCRPGGAGRSRSICPKKVRLASVCVNTRRDYGFAVKFVDVPEDARQKLERTIERLRVSRT